MRLLLLTLMMSCAPQKHSLDIDDSNHTVGGEAYQYVVVQFEFISSIKQLCSDIHPHKDYTDSIERDKAIAQCTFDNLSILDSALISEFTNEFCDDTINYNDLTPEEQAEVDTLCEVL